MKNSAAIVPLVAAASLLLGACASPPPRTASGYPDGCAIETRNCRILKDADAYRVVDYIARAGDTAPMHSHPANAVVVIDGGKAKYTLPDGRIVDVDAKRGDVFVGKPTSHASEHPTDVHVIVVELKDPNAELRCHE